MVWEVAMLADAAARVLVEADRPQEALARLAGVADRLRGIEAFGEALQVEMLVGELLLRTGRAGEAEPLLRSVLGGAADLVGGGAADRLDAVPGAGRDRAARPRPRSCGSGTG